MHKIYLIRGHKVMLDKDLAELYGVETKRLKEQVKRNSERFPEQYMFGLTESEFAGLKQQYSAAGWGGTRYLPIVFTEHGVLQLSNVLKSDRAIQVSFKIIDVFVRLRKMLTENADLRLAIERLEKKTDNNIRNIDLAFQYIDELSLKNKTVSPPRKKIGYKLPVKR